MRPDLLLRPARLGAVPAGSPSAPEPLAAPAEARAASSLRLGPAALATSIAFIMAAALFIALPQIDIGFSRLFFGPEGFLLGGSTARLFLPKGLRVAAWIFGAVLAVGACWTLFRGTPIGRFGRREFLFVVLCFALGPGLVVNGVLKEGWGRARPATVTAFGGEAHYSPPLIVSDQCASNCSFASGDVAFAMTFLAFGLLVPTRRILLVAPVVVSAGFGLVRIMQGAHFLSDAVLGAMLMALLVMLLHQLVFGRSSRRQAG